MKEARAVRRRNGLEISYDCRELSPVPPFRDCKMAKQGEAYDNAIRDLEMLPAEALRRYNQILECELSYCLRNTTTSGQPFTLVDKTILWEVENLSVLPNQLAGDEG